MRRLSFPALVGVKPRFNITPSASIPIVVSLDGVPVTWMAHWGLVPGWAHNPSIGNKLAMARGESAHEKPSFREALRKRRALMPADLFYEWQPVAGQRTTKPWGVRIKNEEPFFLGALWEHWTPREYPNAEPLLSCCVITTPANAQLVDIQDRMPLIIDPDDCDRWLNPHTDQNEVRAFMQPYAHDDLRAFRVSSRVNSPAFDDAECIAPLPEGPDDEPPATLPTRPRPHAKSAEQLDAFG